MDNFDRLIETITGKEALHNAVGISYETVTEEESMDQEPGHDENLSSEEETCCIKKIIEIIHKTLHKKNRRQAYNFLDILPYRYST